MKKAIFMILIAILLCFMFCGCSEEKDVINTLESKEEIQSFYMDIQTKIVEARKQLKNNNYFIDTNNEWFVKYENYDLNEDQKQYYLLMLDYSKSYNKLKKTITNENLNEFYDIQKKLSIFLKTKKMF